MPQIFYDNDFKGYAYNMIMDAINPGGMYIDLPIDITSEVQRVAEIIGTKVKKHFDYESKNYCEDLTQLAKGLPDDVLNGKTIPIPKRFTDEIRALFNWYDKLYVPVHNALELGISAAVKEDVKKLRCARTAASNATAFTLILKDGKPSIFISRNDGTRNRNTVQPLTDKVNSDLCYRIFQTIADQTNTPLLQYSENSLLSDNYELRINATNDYFNTVQDAIINEVSAVIERNDKYYGVTAAAKLCVPMYRDLDFTLLDCFCPPTTPCQYIEINAPERHLDKCNFIIDLLNLKPSLTMWNGVRGADKTSSFVEVLRKSKYKDAVRYEEMNLSTWTEQTRVKLALLQR